MRGAVKIDLNKYQVYNIEIKWIIQQKLVGN